MVKLKPASRALVALMCGAGVVGAAVTGAGAAGADPGPGEKKIIIDGRERTDIDRVILRENIDRYLPGYQLPSGSPGVIILKNGQVQAVPEGAVLRQRR